MSTTRQQIVYSIKTAAKELGRVPTYREFIAKYGINGWDFYNVYDSWNDALIEANFPPSQHRTKKYTDDEFLQQLKSLVDDLGRVPTQEEFDSKADTASVGAVCLRFGSWNKFLIKAGYGVKNRVFLGPTKELIIAQVNMVKDELGRVPRYLEFIKDPRTVSGSSIRKHFGGWNNLLTEAGLETNIKKVYGTNSFDNEALIIQVRHLASKLGRTPTVKEFENCVETCGRNTVIEHFGSWNDFLRVAGLKPNLVSRRGISNEELIEQLVSLSVELGRTPKYDEFASSDKTVSVSTAVRRFGSWNNFVEAAGLK